MNFYVGQKVVCRDDTLTGRWLELLPERPVKDRIYVVREVRDSFDYPGEIALLLIGLKNPPSFIHPHVERAFRAIRFRPLSELKEEARQRQSEEATA